MSEKKDEYSKNQDHFNSKFRREMKLVSNYQNAMDVRLSIPKQTIEISDNRLSTERMKVYRNSTPDLQKQH